MRTTALVAVAVAAALSAAAPGALAQNNRTFVSGAGLDTNPCSATAPCRGFTQALSVTNAGGEITVLDSAGYGPVTITKAISITAIGVEAAITATSTDGIDINAGASDVVTLRGLTLTQTNATGTFSGIVFNSGGTLNVQNCVVRGFTQDGVRLLPSTPSTINVSDTIVADNAQKGLNLGPLASASAFYERVQSTGNGGSGFSVTDVNATAGATIKAIAANSISSQNVLGFGVTGLSTAPPNFLILNSASYNNNSNGIATFFGGNIIITNLKVYGNSNGLDILNGGTIKTFGNNYFANNGANNGSLTPIAQQ